MAQEILDKVKSAISNAKDAISAGNKQTEGLGAELAARSEMNRNGEAALNGGTPAEPTAKPAPKANPAGPRNPNHRQFGDAEGQKRGEKLIDTKDMLKPLGSFKKGTDSVPKSGVYQVHEGEKVTPSDDNKSEHSPEEKAHFHRAMSHLHAGALHRHLGVPEGKPIPMEKKEEAAKSDNPHVAAMGRMAVAMHGWKHPKK